MSRVTRGDDGFIKEDPVEAYRMPLLEHLHELRKRLLIAVASVLVTCTACFAYAQELWVLLVAPMNLALQETGRGTMAMTNPIEGVMTYMQVSLFAGIGLAAPILFYQVWKFVAPGLYPKEQRLVLPLVIGSTTLFVTGVLFCYLVVFRFAFPVFLTVTPEDVEAVVSMDSYLRVATMLLLSFGVCFQLPVVVYLLSVLGLISHRDMIRFFRYAMVGIAVLASVLTPTTDLLSMMLMAVPLSGLYVLSIGVSWVFSTKTLTPAAEAPPAEG